MFLLSKMSKVWWIWIEFEFTLLNSFIDVTALCNNAFAIDDFLNKYTKIDPFIYSHDSKIITVLQFNNYIQITDVYYWNVNITTQSSRIRLNEIYIIKISVMLIHHIY